MAVYDVVGDVVSDAPLQNDKGKAEKIYKDEIISSFNAVITPAKYRQMRRIAHFVSGKAELFVAQAKFMEDFKDELLFKGDFTCYYPTYEDMTIQQLRGYFTWRTAVREGYMQPAPTSFIFLHIYELLNGVGVASPQDAMQKLMNIYEAYAGEQTVRKYLSQWLTDYAVYYGLEMPFKTDADENYKLLAEYKNYSSSQIFNALAENSTYNIKKSKIYAKHPEITEQAVYNVYCDMSAHYMSLGQKDLISRFFKSTEKVPYKMFAGAVYLDSGIHPDCERRVNAQLWYTCVNNRWYCKKIYSSKDGQKHMGELLRSVDNILRERLNLTPTLKNVTLGPARIKIIDNAVERAMLEHKRQKQVQAAKNITIDVSGLDIIRKNADEITKKLTVEQNEPDFDSISGKNISNDYMHTGSFDAPQQQIEAEVAEKDMRVSFAEEMEEQTLVKEEESHENRVLDQNQVLDQNEIEYLRRVINGGDHAGLAKQLKIMPQVIIESINQKLYDVFADTVLEGDSPQAVEDYLEQLKGMFNL